MDSSAINELYLHFSSVTDGAEDLEVVSVDMFYQDEDKKDIILAVTYLKSSVKKIKYKHYPAQL